MFLYLYLNQIYLHLDQLMEFIVDYWLDLEYLPLLLIFFPCMLRSNLNFCSLKFNWYILTCMCCLNTCHLCKFSLLAFWLVILIFFYLLAAQPGEISLVFYFHLIYNNCLRSSRVFYFYFFVKYHPRGWYILAFKNQTCMSYWFSLFSRQFLGILMTWPIT